MRHGFRGRRINRTSEHRKAMFANMAAALSKKTDETRAYAASDSSCTCTGPLSWPLALTSRSTNSITAIGALSP